MDELLEQSRDPVFSDAHRNVSVSLAARLTELADELTSGENVAEAFADARLAALLAVDAIARRTKPATFPLDNPPSEAEKRFGSVLGQAFHEGCPLADVALAAALPEKQVVAIGKRTSKRSAWLDHL
ncbi:MAG: hypothetical protein ACXVHB_21095 [Solirubrobacteraceae bacterium]